MLIKRNIQTDLQFTGERYIPNIAGDIELEHLHRYRAVESLIAGKIVADVACGEGYGSDLMAKYAENVVGVDISIDAVLHAKKTYQKNNLSFICAPGQKTNIESHSIDVVISFETIEHHDQHDAMLVEIKRILKPGGILIMSSPDKYECTDKTGVKNPHHVKELYKEEFEKLIGTYFRYYDLYGQRVVTGSALFSLVDPKIRTSYAIESIEESFANVIKNPMYWLVVASDQQPPQLSEGMLETNVNIDNLRLGQYENEVRKKTISQRDSDILILQNHILQVNKELAAKSDELAEKSNELITNKQHSDNLYQITVAQDAQFQDIFKSTSWRLTRPIRMTGTLVRLVIGRDFQQIWSLIKKKIAFSSAKLTPLMVKQKIRLVDAKFNDFTSEFNSSMNHPALQGIVEKRARQVSSYFIHAFDATPKIKSAKPNVDISLVTYNSGRWLKRFFASVEKLDYPLSQLTIYVRDNGSTDNTLEELNSAQQVFNKIGIEMQIMQGSNIGFGAGHNANIKRGRASLVLVSNVDLYFEPDALDLTIKQTMVDDHTVVAWEFRQKPYEHPKYYDPVTGFTNWNAHACVLIRREAFIAVGGYDENIFMYGEDVDLSYNFRANGYDIKYVPKAVVWHDTYEEAAQIKPLQYAGSTFANLYLRLKYGTVRDIAAIPRLQSLLSTGAPAYEGAHADVRANGRKLFAKAITALIKRRKSKVNFPFRSFDYDLTRAGAFYKLEPILSENPLVSVITRTYKGRTTYLQEAIISVANQTYPNIEHIIVEDGSSTLQDICAIAAQKTDRLQYISLDKVGRCKAGNAGLTAAKGKYCLFLDDDDLLFADHIEVLVAAMLKDPAAVATYSPAMEIATEVTNKEKGEYVETEYSFPAGLFQAYSFEKLQVHNYIAIQSILFERWLFEQRGGFDETLEYLEDWNLWVRYAYENKFVYVPKLTSMYRVPASKIEFERRFQLLNSVYEGVFKKNTDWLTHYGKSN